MEPLIIRDLLNWADILWPSIFAISLVFGPLMRFSLYYVQSGKWRFIEQLERRIMRHGNNEYEDTRKVLFHDLFKKLLEKTHYEIFFLRTQNKRRRFDRLFSYLDNLYNMEDVCQMMVDQGVHYSLYISKRSRDFSTVKYFMLERQNQSELIFGFFKLMHLNRILNALPLLVIFSSVAGVMIKYYLQLIDIDSMEEFRWLPFIKSALNYFFMGIALASFQWLVNVFLSAEILAKNSLLGLESGLKCIWEISILDEIIEREGLGEELDKIGKGPTSEEEVSSQISEVVVDDAAQEKLLNKYIGLSAGGSTTDQDNIGHLIAAKNKLKGKTNPDLNMPSIQESQQTPLDNLLATSDDTMNNALQETFDLVANSDFESNSTDLIKIKVNRPEHKHPKLVDQVKNSKNLEVSSLPELPDLPIEDVKADDDAA